MACRLAVNNLNKLNALKRGRMKKIICRLNDLLERNLFQLVHKLKLWLQWNRITRCFLFECKQQCVKGITHLVNLLMRKICLKLAGWSHLCSRRKNHFLCLPVGDPLLWIQSLMETQHHVLENMDIPYLHCTQVRYAQKCNAISIDHVSNPLLDRRPWPSMVQSRECLATMWFHAPCILCHSHFFGWYVTRPCTWSTNPTEK